MMKSNSYLFIVLMIMSILSGCGWHKEKFVDIKPNETAFLVMMDGEDAVNKQQKFKSLDYLENIKVAAKRVSIPQRKYETGPLPFQYDWIDAAMLVIVDRTPVSREFTKEPTTGTSDKDQSIKVESIESIGFSLGATVTISVTEEDAARFLFYYSGKTLEEVMDQNIRNSMVSYLTSSFGVLTLEECQKQKKAIFEAMKESLSKEYKDNAGITILNMGLSEGFTYENPEVQTAIDKAWIAEREKARAEVDAKTKETQAKATATAEIERAKGESMAMEERVKGEAKALMQRAEAEARANKLKAESINENLLRHEWLVRWNGVLPNMMSGEKGVMIGYTQMPTDKLTKQEQPIPIKEPLFPILNQ